MGRHPLTPAERELANLRVYVQTLVIEKETLKELIEIMRVRLDFWRKMAKGQYIEGGKS